MYDDYDLDYTYTNDYADLDEYYTHDLDEDYARDGQDYEALAYRHYAWYNKVTTHETICLPHRNVKYESH